MANIVPGVRWQPVNVGARAKRRKGRGLCGHVAVSTSKNLVPGPNADWHFYLPKDGPAIQYIDLDLQCWATGAGNSTMAAFESEGGMGSEAQVNAEPWTPNQIEWAARILAHMHVTEGVPLRVMESSASGERGFGTHRLGVPGYMVPGTEQWSSARGKSCPGTAKHAQRFAIVTRAQQIVGGTPVAPIEEDDMFDANDRRDLQMIAAELRGPRWEGWPGLGPAGAKGSVVQGISETLANARKIAGLEAAVTSLAQAVAQQAGGEGVDVDALAAHLDATVRGAMADTIKVQVSVDADRDPAT